MTNLSSISTNAVIGLTILVGVMFAYQVAVRQPSIGLIYAPAGEARPLPVDMLRLRPATW